MASNPKRRKPSEFDLISEASGLGMSALVGKVQNYSTDGEDCFEILYLVGENGIGLCDNGSGSAGRHRRIGPGESCRWVASAIAFMEEDVPRDEPEGFVKFSSDGLSKWGKLMTQFDVAKV